ncbi:MAG: DUF885 domain-containing protein [Betaproteobacteria bacterium]
MAARNFQRLFLAVCFTAMAILSGASGAAEIPVALVLSPAAKVVRSPGERQFESLAKQFVESFFKTNPEQATAIGEHRFDKRVRDLSVAGLARERKLYHATLAAVKRINAASLSSQYRVDYHIMMNELEGRLFAIEVLKEQDWDALSYVPANGIYVLLARDFAPLPSRLASVKARLEQIPGALKVAKANLKNPPRIFTETAVDQNKGAIGLIRDELDMYVKDAPQMKAALAPSRKKAIAALEAYGAWLEKELLPRSTGDFRLGAANYRRKLKFSLESDITPEEILRRAEGEFAATQRALYDVAAPLYKQYFPQMPLPEDHKAVVRAVFKKLGDDQPNDGNVLQLATNDLAEATAFIREKKLLTLPDAPVKIIVMPEFQRGVATAYCDAPGALEKNLDTFFAISPTPAGWSAEQIDSYYREDNRSMLKDLTVHEAMPGHYVQGVIANKAYAPTLMRRIVYSGTFAEGWAVYAEQMMADAGFGGAPVKMQQLKMRLRVITNAIIDQKIHAGSMTEKEAMDLMMNEGFQEEREAAGKWRRALLTSTQLSTYYVGSAEVIDLRRAYEAKYGAGDMRKMHDSMLSFGTISVRHVRELMGL